VPHSGAASQMCTLGGSGGRGKLNVVLLLLAYRFALQGRVDVRELCCSKRILEVERSALIASYLFCTEDVESSKTAICIVCSLDCETRAVAILYVYGWWVNGWYRTLDFYVRGLFVSHFYWFGLFSCSIFNTSDPRST